METTNNLRRGQEVIVGPADADELCLLIDSNRSVFLQGHISSDILVEDGKYTFTVKPICGDEVKVNSSATGSCHFKNANNGVIATGQLFVIGPDRRSVNRVNFTSDHCQVV